MNSLDVLRQKPVYVYCPGDIAPNGSGSAIRQYTNIRAYLDLGFRVEAVQFARPENKVTFILPEGAAGSGIQLRAVHPGWRNRLAYRLGFPFENALEVLYNERQTVLDAVLEYERRTPGAIHHFEYASTANVAITLRAKNLNTIWSCHDWESDRTRKLIDMREEAGHRRSAWEKKRRQAYARQVEKRVAESCSLVLMIAAHETKIFREQLNIPHVELLPTSWPDESQPLRARDWGDDGILRLLHLGSPDALAGYYSLKFILGEVFPRIPEPARRRTELWIVGKMQDTPYSRAIRELARPYPQVRFFGFAEDVRPFYAQCDLQVVGNSIATGLRTRIIESFVCGLPVLSIPQAAEGIVGLKAGVNILLEENAEAFAARLTRLLDEPQRLPSLARAGRVLYERFYARGVEASTLQTLLEKYFSDKGN